MGLVVHDVRRSDCHRRAGPHLRDLGATLRSQSLRLIVNASWAIWGPVKRDPPCTRAAVATNVDEGNMLEATREERSDRATDSAA